MLLTYTSLMRTDEKACERAAKEAGIPEDDEACLAKPGWTGLGGLWGRDKARFMTIVAFTCSWHNIE